MDARFRMPARARERRDRKSTRLNSSHGYISYAVFCLKKKKTSLNPRAVDIARGTSVNTHTPRGGRRYPAYQAIISPRANRATHYTRASDVQRLVEHHD